MVLFGVDTSSHQGAVDWPALKAAGFDFAIIKCTGGAQYVNPYYQQQLAGARAANFVVGHYAYDGEPSVGTGSPDEEARWFLAHLDLRPGELVALDAEERATRDPARYAHWRDVVRAATGVMPLLYTFPSFVTELGADAWAPVADMPLWYAHYWDDGNGDRWPAPPPPWVAVTIWQYNGGIALPGTTFPTDCNVFAGTPDELRALGKPADVTAETKPRPAPAPSPFVAAYAALWR